ncbi:MAG: hypothetical protein JJU11_02080 [Candidatus Sumerlaeia bacterium]|nr:hypothetical protein [Candidatus Sumerlaeia bacterium]
MDSLIWVSMVAKKKASAEKKSEPISSAVPQEEKVASGDHTVISRIILVITLAVFAIFMVFTVLLFKSGDEIHWKRELTDIERMHERGRYEEAAARLFQFGRDRPGAQQTFNWNRQMGEFHADAKDWATSARFYDRALQLRPAEPGINALAGESHWNAGNRERAIQLFNREIDDVNPALGDHDRAFFHIGLHHYEEGDYRRALENFASISEPDDWKDRIDPVRQRIDEEIIEPARRLASSRANSE